MAILGFELLLRFLWGSALILFWISRRETSERFLRVAYWIALGCIACAAWLALNGYNPSERPLALASLANLTVGLALYCFFFGRAARVLGFILILTAPFYVLHTQNIATQLNFVISSALLGSVFMGQFLGHWFLNVPNLHIRELKRVTTLMMASIALKSFEIVYHLFISIGLHPQSMPVVDAMGRPLSTVLSESQTLSHMNLMEGMFSLSGDLYFGLGSYGLIILITRVLWGTLAPFILAGLVYQTVKMRSTQSATGILYAMCVMILVGEGTAIYLKNILGYLL